MNQIEELAEPEEPITPDAWAAVEVGDHTTLHRYIEAHTQAFLAQGGQIEVVPHGATGLSDGLNVFISRGLAHPGSASKDMARHRERMNAASMANRLRRDEEAIAAIGKALDGATSLTDIARRSRVSPPRVGRFLKAFFSGDSRAQPFIPQDRETRRKEHEAEVLPLLRKAKADGLIGLFYIAKKLHLSFDTVKYLDEKYGLNLPRGNKENKRRYQAQFTRDAQQ